MGYLEVLLKFSANMGQRVICTLMILLLAHVTMIECVSAQWVPAVNLECRAVNPSGNLEINATSDSNTSDYADCTVSNPNMYQETISITVNSGPLASASPGEIYVDANSEVDFQVMVRAENTTSNQTIELRILAEVVEVNGLPSPISASSESLLLVDIFAYEESNETEVVMSDESGSQSLFYAIIGGVFLLVLILFIFIKRRKELGEIDEENGGGWFLPWISLVALFGIIIVDSLMNPDTFTKDQSFWNSLFRGSGFGFWNFIVSVIIFILLLLFGALRLLQSFLPDAEPEDGMQFEIDNEFDELIENAVIQSEQID